jgi:hypothetical protein
VPHCSSPGDAVADAAVPIKPLVAATIAATRKSALNGTSSLLNDWLGAVRLLSRERAMPAFRLGQIEPDYRDAFHRLLRSIPTNFTAPRKLALAGAAVLGGRA